MKESPRKWARPKKNSKKPPFRCEHRGFRVKFFKLAYPLRWRSGVGAAPISGESLAQPKQAQLGRSYELPSGRMLVPRRVYSVEAGFTTTPPANQRPQSVSN